MKGIYQVIFDTVHHKLLMQCVRKRINCERFNGLLRQFIKAGHIERNLFCATTQGGPQGGVTSPLLSNIMLNEFDQYLDELYLLRISGSSGHPFRYGPASHFGIVRPSFSFFVSGALA